MTHAATENIQSANETQVRERVEAWASAVRAADMAGVLAFHTPTIVMFDVPPPLAHTGLAAYQKTWELFFAMQGQGSFNLDELHITAGDDVAFCSSIVTCGGADAASQFKVRLTLGLQKIGGTWMIAHEHHSVPSE